MTVHARRYGRWCREHFDTVHPQSAEPVDLAAGDQAVATDDEAQQVRAGEVPAGEPQSGQAGRK